MDRIEINEAFAAIAIVVTRELGLPEDIVNVEGCEPAPKRDPPRIGLNSLID